MRNFLFITILLCGAAQQLIAQQGKVEVKTDSLIDDMLDRHRWALNNTPLKGWSIQIMVTDDSYKAEQAKLSFLKRYPNIKVSLDWQAPYHRLQVGAFLNKGDATSLLQRLVPDYPDAYLVINNKIKPRDIMESPF